MNRNTPAFAFPGDSTASGEFRKDRFPVRPLEHAEKGSALQLAWRVFCEFESPDYALGFQATDREKTVNGIRFTPMEYNEQEGTHDKRN